MNSDMTEWALSLEKRNLAEVAQWLSTLMTSCATYYPFMRDFLKKLFNKQTGKSPGLT